MSNISFKKSEQYLARSLQTIPLGSQTFSKSKLVYPDNVSPLFLESGKGAIVTDPDGNQYIDFVNGLLSVMLGYGDEDVNAAVKKQLDNGVTLSLPHRLEFEVSELITQLVPCADMVRFGKNGSDSTSAAVRLARAYTGKEKIAVCGYHGWQDWYIGSTTRDLGVPKCVKALTHKFNYNDIASLEAIFDENNGEIAAVIMEPMNVYFPENDFLAEVKKLTHKHNAVLIFDETITGFRFHIGGAQTLLNVTPDLATFGKGMANGFPLSAVTGRRDIMMLMEDIFYSGTFGGETLSLAAAKATLEKLKTKKVLEHIENMGTILITGLKELLSLHNANSLFSVSGHPAWSFLLLAETNKASAQQLTSLMQQEMHARGLLCGSAHNISFAHQREHIQALLDAYNEIIPLIIKINNEGNFNQYFHGVVTQPVFKVR
jgi:glutamate-1-semialdehyde 2,1-aminomutase